MTSIPRASLAFNSKYVILGAIFLPYTYVYHPSRQHMEQWKKIAAKAKTPLSKFIIETVDSVIDENQEFKSRRETAKEIEALKNENKVPP